MSTEYYIVSKKKQEAINNFNKFLEEQVQKTQEVFKKYIKKHECISELLDEDHVSNCIKQIKYHMEVYNDKSEICVVGEFNSLTGFHSSMLDCSIPQVAKNETYTKVKKLLQENEDYILEDEYSREIELEEFWEICEANCEK